jgi:antitoxin MazE
MITEIIRDMTRPVKSRIVQVGNSKGIRLPKLMLEQSGIIDNIEIEVSDGQILIKPASKARVGWDEAFAQMVVNGDEEPILDVTNEWDDTEWEW